MGPPGGGGGAGGLRDVPARSSQRTSIIDGRHRPISFLAALLGGGPGVEFRRRAIGGDPSHRISCARVAATVFHSEITVWRAEAEIRGRRAISPDVPCSYSWVASFRPCILAATGMLYHRRELLSTSASTLPLPHAKFIGHPCHLPYGGAAHPQDHWSFGFSGLCPLADWLGVIVHLMLAGGLSGNTAGSLWFSTACRREIFAKGLKLILTLLALNLLAMARASIV